MATETELAALICPGMKGPNELRLTEEELKRLDDAAGELIETGTSGAAEEVAALLPRLVAAARRDLAHADRSTASSQAVAVLDAARVLEPEYIVLLDPAFSRDRVCPEHWEEVLAHLRVELVGGAVFDERTLWLAATEALRGR